MRHGNRKLPLNQRHANLHGRLFRRREMLPSQLALGSFFPLLIDSKRGSIIAEIAARSSALK
jgi:hypothetical protein